MRRLAVALVLVGLVLLAGGLFFGCGSFFGWNGRHVLVEKPITLGAPVSAEIESKTNRRYTFSARVAVDRSDTTPEEAAAGAAGLQLQMPVVMSLRDDGGNVLLQQAGWLGTEPPTRIYGDASGGATGRGARSLYAERDLGPYPTSGPQKLRADAELGPDRLGLAKITAASLVVYDDAMPGHIVVPFVVAGVGGLILALGAVLGSVLLARRVLRSR